MESPNQNQVTDEQVEEQIKEISSKADKTPEDTDKLESLKTEKQTRFQKRIDKLTWESKTAQEELEKERERARELEEKLNAKPVIKDPVRVVEDTVEIGGQKYYTDEALISMVKAGKMGDDEAFKYQRVRDKAEVKEDLKNDFKKEKEEQSFKETRIADQEKVLSEYPQFDTRHKDFNPNDPLYKEANEIFQNGYCMKANGMTLAIKQAKRVLGITDAKIDNTKNTSMYSPGSPGVTAKQLAPLTDDEKEFAIRTYRDIKNPRTGRNYTDTEAITKHQEAIAKRKG